MHIEPLALSPIERRQRLLDWIEERRRASLPEILEEFGVSPATARRDLDALAVTGRVQRVHGGVRALRGAPPESPVLQRAHEQAAEKQRIARAAAALVGAGETVFLGSGTTVEAVARQLADHRELTVITNSLLVLNALAAAPGVQIICLGGTLRQSEHSFIGPLATNALAEFRSLKVVMGIRAVDAQHGLTNAYLDESLLDRAIISGGGEVILVADHTKCGRVSSIFVAPLDRISTLVTDIGAPREFIAAAEEIGVRVLAV